MSQVILLTGASSGIGYDTAKDLAAAGHTVYGAARRVEKLEELRPFGIIPLQLDITDEDSIKKAVETIITKQGRIDALVNNAGYGSYGAIEDVTLDEARNQFEVNLFGLARLTQLILPQMRAQCFGRIITSLQWVGASPPSWAPGTTPPSTPSKPSAMRCAWKPPTSAFRSPLSSPAVSKLTGV